MSLRQGHWRVRRVGGGWLILSACALTMVAGAGRVHADALGTAGDKAEIELLKARLEKLEQKVDNQSAVAAGADEGSALVQLPSGLHGVQMGGYVDTSYTYNFNEPNNRTSGFRAFDTRSEDFMLNQAKLFLAKPVSTESPVGFRTDLIFGTDAEVTSSVSTGLGSASNEEIDLFQGYVEYLAPLGNGLDLKFGKFTTLHGAEVTESKDNWNFSRSFLYLYGEPLTHTGIRAHYPVLENLMLMAGVNNGWDIVDDNNKAKSLEFGFTSTPIEGVSLTSSYLVGAEGTDGHDKRHLFTTVLGYEPIESLHLKLAYDYGHETDVLGDGISGANGSWQGVAAYAKYDVTDKWSMATRAEVFSDQDGARTLVNAAATSPTGSGIADLDLFELTFTNEYQIHEHLIGRFEYRLDKADSDVFRHDQGFKDYQNTVAVEFIAPF